MKKTISAKSRNLGVSWGTGAPEATGGLRTVRAQLERGRGRGSSPTLWVGGQRVVGCDAVAMHVASGVSTLLQVLADGPVEVTLA